MTSPAIQPAAIPIMIHQNQLDNPSLLVSKSQSGIDCQTSNRPCLQRLPAASSPLVLVQGQLVRTSTNVEQHTNDILSSGNGRVNPPVSLFRTSFPDFPPILSDDAVTRRSP